MRLYIQNLDPYVHGLIKQHQADHNHHNQKETVECLIKRAMGIEKIVYICPVCGDFITKYEDDNGYCNGCNEYWKNLSQRLRGLHR